MFRIKMIVVLAILAGFTTQPASADELSNYQWDPPTEGSPVHHYVVCVSMDNGDCVTLTVEPTTNSIQLALEANTVYTIMVAAVDAEGHQGPWSMPSVPYSYPMPGGCGQPYRTN